MIRDLVLVMLHKFQSTILRRLFFQSSGTALLKMQCVSSKDDLQISTPRPEIVKQQCQKYLPSDTAVLLFDGVYHGGGGVATSYASGLQFVSGLQPSTHSFKILRPPWVHATAARQFAITSQNRNPDNHVVDEEEDDEETEGSESEDDDGSTFEEEDDGQLDSEEEEDGEELSKEVIQEKPAKPAKPAKQKPSEPKGGILNEAIMARTIRLVGDARDHKVVSREEALSMAKKKNLDLVMVDARANPPVCKIFDYHKEEYKQEKIQKERKKKKGDMVRLNDVKEVRFTSKTDFKDLKMKVQKAKKFMDHGHRVKFVAIHGTGGSQGELLDKIFPLIEDVAVIEQGPRVERVSAWVMLRHVKFGPVKKKPPKAQPAAVVSEHVEGHDDLGSTDSELHSDDNQTNLPLHPQNSLQRSTQMLAKRKEKDSTPERFLGQGKFEKTIHPSQDLAASGPLGSSQSSPLHVHQRQTPHQGPQRVPLQNLQGLPRYLQPSQGSQGVQRPQPYRPPHQDLQMGVVGQMEEEKLKEVHDSDRLDLEYNDLWNYDKQGANVSQGPPQRTPSQDLLGFPPQNLQGLARQDSPQGPQGVVGQMGEYKLKEEHDSDRLALDYNVLWRNNKQGANISQGPPQRMPLQGPVLPQNLQGLARQQHSPQGRQGVVGQMGEEKLKEEHDIDRLDLDYNDLWRNDKQGANVSQGPPQRAPLQGPLGFPPQNLQGLARQQHSPQGPQGVQAPQMHPPPPPMYPPTPQGAQGLRAPQMYPPPPQGAQGLRAPQMYPPPPQMYPPLPQGAQGLRTPQLYPPPPQMYPPPAQGAQGLRDPKMYPPPPRGRGFSPQNQQIYRSSPPASPEVPSSHHGSRPGFPFQGADRYPPLHGGLSGPQPQDNRYPTPPQGSEGFLSQGAQRYPLFNPGPQNYPLPPASQRFPAPQGSQESSSLQSPLQNSGEYNPVQAPRRYSPPQGQKVSSPWFSPDGEGHKEYAPQQGSQQSGFTPSPHLQGYPPPPVTDFPPDKS